MNATTIYTPAFWAEVERLLDSPAHKCFKCGRVRGATKLMAGARRKPVMIDVRPVLIGEAITPENLRLACDVCFPGEREPRYDKRHAASLNLEMFAAKTPETTTA